jgi:hypothetical protein
MSGGPRRRREQLVTVTGQVVDLPHPHGGG